MRRLGTLLSIALLSLLGSFAQANDCGGSDCGDAGCATCCDPCGGCCDTGCGGGGKYCELKVGKKKIKVVCYGCECDDVCLPCPSTPGCKHCETLCPLPNDGSCDKCGGCGCESCCDSCPHPKGCKVRWQDWCPSECGTIYNRKKLVKYEIEKEVPDYKWVVVDPCKPAAAKAGDAKAGDSKTPTPATKDAPPAPPAPKPVSFSRPVKKSSTITKPAPRTARVGEVIPLTEAEIKQVEQQIRQVNFEVEAAPAPAPAPVKKAATKSATKEVLPWGLFSK